jgi:hypothetical protein
MAPETTERTGIKKLVKGWGSMLTIAGALILFFSWTITNTIQSRYSALKESIEQA